MIDVSTGRLQRIIGYNKYHIGNIPRVAMLNGG